MKQQTLFGSLWRKARKSFGGQTPSILIAGTSAHSGKSWVATAICRHLKRRGVQVAPFQALSRSVDASSCPDDGSIAVEQARQAEACGLSPATDMNPLRCVPASGGGYDVLAHGELWKRVETLDLSAHFEELSEIITESYQRLAERSELVVIDGMGGAAELDQASSDIANLSLAERLGSRVLLACNADRGGVFASVIGTVGLVTPAQQGLIKAFLVNGFRGGPEAFRAGVEIIEERGGRPCLGVLPYSRTIRLGAGPQQQSVAVSSDELKVVIVDLPGRSREERQSLLPHAQYISEPTRYDPDVVIIPPTSSTLGDLLWMKKNGLDRWILDRRKEGTAIWGFGGGSYMLGRFVSDPMSRDPSRRRVPSLGLLPTQTDILPDRGKSDVLASLWGKDVVFGTQAPASEDGGFASGPLPFADVNGQPEGFRQRGIVGTVLEGSLQSADVIEDLLAEVQERRSKPAKTVETGATRESHYEKLADWFEEHVDVALFDELYMK